MNPTAYFDTLFLANILTELVEGFSKSEIHLFSYAGCLLWLYDQKPYSDWDYDFISSSTGLPYSKDIDQALEDSELLGFVKEGKDLFVLTGNGRNELNLLLDFESNQLRQEYLEGAADSLLVLTPGQIREALEYDPNLAYLKNRKQSEWLLREPDRDRIYSNFSELRKFLTTESSDLAVPLITWLKYLLQIGRRNGILTSN